MTVAAEGPRRASIDELRATRFHYVGVPEVAREYDALGIVPENRSIEAIYLSPDGSLAVAVATLPESITEGHFGIVRGVDLTALMADAEMLRRSMTGQVSGPGRPRLREAVSVVFNGMVIPPRTVNVVTRAGKNGIAHAEVLIGENVMATGDLSYSEVRYPLDLGGEFTVDTALDRHTSDEVHGILQEFGYGDSKMLVDEVVLDGGDVYASLSLTSERTRGYREMGALVFPPTDGYEAIAQALIVASVLKGEIVPQDTTALFKGIEGGRISGVAAVPSMLTIQAARLPGEGFNGSGVVYCGNSEIVRANVSGALMERVKFPRVIEIQKRRLQGKDQPLFAAKG